MNMGENKRQNCIREDLYVQSVKFKVSIYLKGLIVVSPLSETRVLDLFAAHKVNGGIKMKN